MIHLQKIFVCNEDLIIVPNAFTPNGDGLNDEFVVRGSLEIELVRIYNRWGEIIFESSGAGPSWDGTHNGQSLNRDVFIYSSKLNVDSMMIPSSKQETLL